MEIGPILGITAAVYLIGTWLMVWGRAFLFDYPPTPVGYSKEAALPVLILLEEAEEQLEYAIRHTLWFSAVQGVPLRVYLPPQSEAVYPILSLIRRNWPDLQLEQTNEQPKSFSTETWIYDLRHS